MMKNGGITFCVLRVAILCLFVDINCSVLSKKARKVHRNMEVRLNSFHNELINALKEIDDIRENRGTCLCTDPNTTVTDVNLGQPEQSKINKEKETFRTYVERVKSGFKDEKMARKRFEQNIMNFVKEQIKLQEPGIWTTWSIWKTCSVSCGVGLQRRTRTCTQPTPGPHGYPCVGDANDYRSCTAKACEDPMVYFAVNQPSDTLTTAGRPVFRTVVSNHGGAYNMETAVFTAPVKGLYHFAFSFYHKSTADIICYLYHNSTYITAAYTGSNDHWATASVAVYLYLDIGDTVDIRKCNNWENVGLSRGTLFTGALVMPS